MSEQSGRRMARVILAFILAAPLFASAPASAEPGDTTWVHTFNQDFYNWATPHDSTFTFPDTTVHYQKVVLFYTIGCPSSPGDCDPWDRLGYLRLGHETGAAGAKAGREIEWIEIARIVTPYDITPPPRPVTCTWEIDVSDYEFLLHGQVTLRNYIETWINGTRGWLATLDFAFIEGEPAWKPFKIVNLWQNYYCVYGDPNQPIENILVPMSVPIDPAADRTKVRVIATGHGQGNTNNCAEFCPREHTVVADGSSFAHTLWRTDCPQNRCSPQGGTWTYPRAGWCPGASVIPWDVELSGVVVPGTNATLDYNVQPYTNLCCPCNPSCVDGQTCPDCDYNSTGHTEPFYALNSHLVFYRINPATNVADLDDAERSLRLDQNRPNPFSPPTAIRYSLAQGGSVAIRILDASGRLIRQAGVGRTAPGDHVYVWDGKDDLGRAAAAGVYFYEVRAGSESRGRKMLLLR